MITLDLFESKPNKKLNENVQLGNAIKALYQKIHAQGDDAVEFMYYDSPIFAQYWDEYEGDLDSIIAEVDPQELQVILDELESAVEDQGLAEGDYNIRRDPTWQKYNPETHVMMYKDGKHKLVKHDQVAKAKSLGWKVRSSLKAFAKGQGGVAEQQVNEISPYDFDSDEDYRDALRAAKRKAQGRSADDYDDYEEEDHDDGDDESYYEKYVRTKGLEEEVNLPYAPGSENLGRANMALLIKAYNSPTSPRLTLTFGNQSVDLDPQDIDAIADYYDDQLPSNADRWDFIRNIMSRYDNFVAMLGKLGRRTPDVNQPGLFQEANKKKDDDNLGAEVRDVRLQRAISKAKGDFPTAGSGLEALAKDFMRGQDQDQQSLDQLRQAERQQNKMLNQISKLDQEQEKEIKDLEQQNSGLSQRLQQLQSVNSDLEKKIAAMTGRREKRQADKQTPAPIPVSTPVDTSEPVAQAPTQPEKPTPEKPIDTAKSADVFKHVAKGLTTEPEAPPTFSSNVRDIKQAKKYADKTSAIARQVAANPDQAANAMAVRQAAESKEKKSEPPEADYGDEYQAMVQRVGQKAKQGPRKTVWDPVKRVYKTVPVNPVKEQEPSRAGYNAIKSVSDWAEKLRAVKELQKDIKLMADPEAKAAVQQRMGELLKLGIERGYTK